MAIPVIDIFAGPGGLGEGFCSLINSKRKRAFKITLSIEKESDAHKTLTLRSFFRQFEKGKAPIEYYDFLKGKISLDQLYKSYPEEAKKAVDEAWLTTLGLSEDAVSYKEVDRKIRLALNEENYWLLIGGPPCQAYSVAGRSRRQETILDEKKDERVGLYKQYLRILAVHNPAVFIMENVKGLLSAETDSSPIFSKILKDLSDPVSAYITDFNKNGNHLTCPGYKIYSLVSKPKKYDIFGNPIFKPNDFVIQAEKYGIPQTRHRVILLGVRNDIKIIPGILQELKKVNVTKVISDLPRIRSRLSNRKDEFKEWIKSIREVMKKSVLTGVDQNVRIKINKVINKITDPHCGTGSEYISISSSTLDYRRDWFLDDKISGVCNHKSRGHMAGDLMRYFFVACYGSVYKNSPILSNFPKELLPNHQNVIEGVYDQKFSDRFRVQSANKPSKTITSHISKDGHYYIHFDPTQCRSLTVREAARIQTFPDNYFFCGARTSQFHQVGNAVPPLLANMIAEIVLPLFAKEQYTNHEHIGKSLNAVFDNG